MNSQIKNENQVHSSGRTESGEQWLTGLAKRGGVMKKVGLFLAMAFKASASRLKGATVLSSARVVRTSVVLVAMTALALFVAPKPASAAARTASVSGNWNNTATWGGSSVPIAGDTVTINSGITVTVTAAAACTSIDFL